MLEVDAEGKKLYTNLKSKGKVEEIPKFLKRSAYLSTKLGNNEENYPESLSIS